MNGHAISRRRGLARAGAGLLAAALAAGLTACSPGESARAAAEAASAPAPAAMYARGRIDWEEGLTRVTAPRAGRLVAWQVAAGDTVRAGQELARLDDREARDAVALAEAELAQATAQQRARAVRHGAARDQARRLAQAESAGVGSGQAADEAQAQAGELAAQLRADEATREIARRRLEQARRQLTVSRVLAPAAGQVHRRLHQVGDAVASGDAVLEIVPPQAPVVLAEVPEVYAAQVRPGLRARVSLASHPGETRDATVRRVARVLAPARWSEEPQAVAGEPPVLECVLDLAPAADGSAWLSGQRVVVQFVP